MLCIKEVKVDRTSLEIFFWRWFRVSIIFVFKLVRYKWSSNLFFFLLPFFKFQKLIIEECRSRLPLPVNFLKKNTARIANPTSYRLNKWRRGKNWRHCSSLEKIFDVFFDLFLIKVSKLLIDYISHLFFCVIFKIINFLTSLRKLDWAVSLFCKNETLLFFAVLIFSNFE